MLKNKKIKSFVNSGFEPKVCKKNHTQLLIFQTLILLKQNKK